MEWDSDYDLTLADEPPGTTLTTKRPMKYKVVVVVPGKGKNH